MTFLFQGQIVCAKSDPVQTKHHLNIQRERVRVFSTSMFKSGYIWLKQLFDARLSFMTHSTRHLKSIGKAAILSERQISLCYVELKRALLIALRLEKV